MLFLKYIFFIHLRLSSRRFNLRRVFNMQKYKEDLTSSRKIYVHLTDKCVRMSKLIGKQISIE